MTSICQRPLPIVTEFVLTHATASVLTRDDSTVAPDERRQDRDLHCRVIIPSAVQDRFSHDGGVQAFVRETNLLQEPVWKEVKEIDAWSAVGGLRVSRERIIALAFQALVCKLELERAALGNPHATAARTQYAVILNLGSV